MSANPTPPAGKYDGNWKAHITSADGLEIDLTFRVSESAIQWLTYTYTGQNNQTCTALIRPASLSAIVDDGFVVKVNSSSSPDTSTVEGKFDSATNASGHISFVEVERARALNCVAHVDAQWAGKKVVDSTFTVANPVTTSWCGMNVNCRQLLAQLLIFGLVNGAILALSAIGVTVIYSTVRTINLAHGDVFALTTVLVTSTINLIGMNLKWPMVDRFLVLVALLCVAVCIGALLSVGVEEAAFRPFRGRSRLAPIIASLGLSFILYQGSLIWRAFQKSFVRGEHRSVPGLAEVPTDGIPTFLPMDNLLHGKIILHFGDLVVFFAAIVFVIATTYILFRTKFGRSIRAVAQNEELSQMVGVPLDGAIRRAFALGGGLAGAAAFIFALYYSRPFGQAGAESGLFAFAAALLGGIGSPIGALVSGLLLGVAGSLSDYFLNAQWTPILVLGLLTGFLVWRRGGLANAGGTDETATRDSVVLTAAGKQTRSKPWLIFFFFLLAVFPIISSKLNLGGEILLRGANLFILLTLGLNILLGLAGVLDLGYAMSYAIGGYTAAILMNQFRTLDFTLVAFCSASAGALFGLLKGVLGVRMRGDYLAVGTLALGLMTQRVIINLDITGGPSGISNVPSPHLFGFSFESPFTTYYLVLFFVILASFLSIRFISSRTGRTLIALSEDETAANSIGIDSNRYRLLAFVLSSVLASLTGALYASTIHYIDPDVAAFNVSAMLLAMVILGGAGSVPGAIFGALLIYGYDKFIIPQLAALIAVYWPQNTFIGMVPNIRGANFFNFGIALYLTVLWRARRGNRDETMSPTGIHGKIQRLFASLRRPK